MTDREEGKAMANINPFRAVRPRADLAERIAALPYDVYNRKEAREAVSGDEYTFLRIAVQRQRRTESWKECGSPAPSGPGPCCRRSVGD